MKYDDLMELKKSICSNYINSYEKNGFIKIKPLPLDDKKDITLDFTTCTICNAKENIKKKCLGYDYVMIQPALRNTHMNVLARKKDDDFFFSYFSMMGGFKYYDDIKNEEYEFSKVIKSEYDFLKQYGEVIVLTIPTQYERYLRISTKIMDYLVQNGCKIKFSDCDEKNLKWKYGIGGVEGYGTRWEISNGGDLVNWGNTINVLVDGIPFGIDFGGGVESLIYANLKLKNSIYASDAMTDSVNEFCSDNSLNEKIVDCIVSSMCIISNKEKIILRDKYVLNSYMTILKSLMVINDVSFNKIMSIVENINMQNKWCLSNPFVVDEFEKHFAEIDKKYNVLLESRNIDKVLRIFDLFYDENDINWKKNKNVVKSHYSKYINNLPDVELLALKKSNNKKIEKRIRYDN